MSAARIAERLLANLVAIQAQHPSDAFLAGHAARRCDEYLALASLPATERAALAHDIDEARVSARTWLISMRWLKPDRESIFGLGSDMFDLQIKALARE